MELLFNAVSESTPGPLWQEQFKRFWPAYRQWYLDRRADDAPDAPTSRAALLHHMPELVPTYDRLVALAGHDDSAARLLSCYCPPPYLSSCSQAALKRDTGSVLVRNYDLHPTLNEGLIMHSRWCGREVIATSEFLWGVADGMNDSGLAVSLAFGGSTVVGHGFGIVLILRYVLEVCDNVAQAIEVMRRIPCHMAYNVTLLDKDGQTASVQLGPDRPIKVVEPAVAANHQGVPENPTIAAFNQTLEREAMLRDLISDADTSTQQLKDAFLLPPLYNTRYEQGFGTLYTTAYYPEEGRVEHVWPDECWEQSFGHFEAGTRRVQYSIEGASAASTLHVVATQSSHDVSTQSPNEVPTQSPGALPNRPADVHASWQAEVHASLQSLEAYIPAWVIDEFGAAAREHRAPFDTGAQRHTHH